MTPVLEFHIKLQRKDFVLDVKAEISDGITGIFGPSGHGKTSLLNSISGIVKPDFGTIYIKGEKVFDSKNKLNVPVKSRKVGYVFQDVRLFPHYSISKNLNYGRKEKSKSAIFDEVVDILKIEHLLNKKPEQCSGGEKQRVAIGRAILSGSQILLMDEPFSAVDVKLRKEIIPFLNAVNQKFKLPIIIVSHDLPDLLSLTDNLLLLQNGEMLAHGKFQDLILDERNLNVMHESGWFNIMHLFVFASLPSKDMVLLKSDKSDLQIQVLTQFINSSVEINTPLKVLIKPENIALAKEQVSNISLRNQIQGTIQKVFLKDGLAFCIVDVGENIIVEVTEASQKNMNLNPGEQVFCLFKSAALKIFSV
jgi:molybdate transport system ATP-binding protein